MREIIESKLKAYGELEDESQLDDLTTALTQFTGTKVDYHYVGDYDSPGYTCNYYVLAWVEQGRAEVMSVTIEWY